jgi:hypothetical protein
MTRPTQSGGIETHTAQEAKMTDRTDLIAPTFTPDLAALRTALTTVVRCVMAALHRDPDLPRSAHLRRDVGCAPVSDDATRDLRAHADRYM